MRLVTVATDSQRYFPYLKKSAEKHGYALHVLGLGQKWQGFAWKLSLMIDYLKRVPQDEFVCFVDAYDVIVLQDAHVALDTFHQLTKGDSSKIVISEDRATLFSVKVVDALFFYQCNGKYLNSGTYMGRASTILKILQSLDISNKDDDQVLMQKKCKSIPNTFKIDSNAEIFLVCCSPAKEIDFKKEQLEFHNGQLRFKKKYYPCFLHATGAANIDNILLKLGYDLKEYKYEQESLWKYFFKYLVHYTRQFVKIYFWLLFFIVCLIVLYLYVHKKRTRTIAYDIKVR